MGKMKRGGGAGGGAPTLDPFDLWHIIEESRLSLDQEAEAQLRVVIELGENRLEETARKEVRETEPPGGAVDYNRETQSRLRSRAEQSVRKFVGVMQEEARTHNSTTISASALRATLTRTFCTVWPLCSEF